MARSLFVFFAIFLSLSVIKSSGQPVNKLFDLSVFDVISKTLLRTELMINQLLDVVNKISAFPGHGLNQKNVPPTNSVTDEPIDESRRQKQTIDSSNIEPTANELQARKSYRTKYNSDYDIDNNANVNTNINTNTNIRRRPTYADLFNDE